MKALPLALLLFATVPAHAAPARSGTWVMHLYLGERLFDDVLQVQPSGLAWITVPDRFTVPVNNLAMTNETVSFDIVADEGKGSAFHVKYEGRFYPGTDTFSGFGTVLDDNSLLGGFVGNKVADRPAPEKFLVAGEQAVRLLDALGGLQKRTAIRCTAKKCTYQDKSVTGSAAQTLFDALVGVNTETDGSKVITATCTKGPATTRCDLQK